MMREKHKKNKKKKDQEEGEGNEVDTSAEEDHYEDLIDYTLKVWLFGIRRCSWLFLFTAAGCAVAGNAFRTAITFMKIITTLIIILYYAFDNYSSSVISHVIIIDIIIIIPL